MAKSKMGGSSSAKKMVGTAYGAPNAQSVMNGKAPKRSAKMGGKGKGMGKGSRGC